MALSDERAAPGVAGGIFVVALATLLLELALPRLLSVTIWYHFSFAAISLALLGMAAGSVTVYVKRAGWEAAGHTPATVAAIASSLMAVTTPLALAVYLQIDPLGGLLGELQWLRLAPALLFTVPFFFSGVVLSLVLSAWARDVSRLYFWDLVGAGLGGLLLVWGLDVLRGPTLIAATGLLAALGGVAFAARDASPGARRVALAAALATSAVVVTDLAAPWLQVRFTKSYDEATLQRVHEEWGPMARLTVFEPTGDDQPAGWSMSTAWRGEAPPVKTVEQDASAGTPITAFDGDAGKLAHLAYDVTAVGYHAQPAKRVAVVGVGGGRDVLTALHFGAERVAGVEVNPDMVALVRDRFADFAGHLYDDPRVEVEVADGRSYLTHSREEFDLIQISLIDSWAASSAGAYVLAENSLYTVEAFETYWRRLAPDGILSVSRWCMSADPPELLRLVTLARETMRAAGVADPSRHVVVVTNQNKAGTVLLRKSPFPREALQRILDTTRRMGFDLAFAPGWPQNWPSFASLMDAPDLDAWLADRVADLAPPTDDRPFFFLMLRPLDALDAVKPYELGLPYNATAVRTLAGLVVLITALVLLLVLIPLSRYASHGLASAPRRGTALLYFSCLGLGFILVEIPLIQSFILFLGHPTYALSVVISTLLVATGVGSWLTGRVAGIRAARRAALQAALVAVTIGLCVLGIDDLFAWALGWPLPARVAFSMALLLPLGLLMGAPFPLGIKAVDAAGATAIIPWAWGVNGAMSVLASVLSFALALSWGYAAVMTIGLACYVVAAGAALRLQGMADTA